MNNVIDPFVGWLKLLDGPNGMRYRGEGAKGDDFDRIASIPSDSGNYLFTVGDLRRLVSRYPRGDEVRSSPAHGVLLRIVAPGRLAEVELLSYTVETPYMTPVAFEFNVSAEDAGHIASRLRSES